MTELDTLAGEWAHALGEWAIPSEILDQAPASPWIHPPQLFRLDDDDHTDSPSFREARAALGDGGTLLDVGCGGGRSSLPLGALLHAVAGVDESEAMLAQFREAAEARRIPCSTVLGRWPEVASEAATADVAVCHHVAYNVAPIVPFLRELANHARRRVVVELTGHHPQSSLNHLWRQFWNVERPQQPTAQLLVEIVRGMGYEPSVMRETRPPRRAAVPRDTMVAFVRQRLCLPASRDPEVDAALGDSPALAPVEFVTVAFSPT